MIRDARREQILAAATRVFTARGFGSTTVSEIAAEAGLSHGLVYHYFRSKDAILGAIARLMVERTWGDVERLEGTAIERIEQYVEKVRTRVYDDVDVRRIIMQACLQDTLPAATRRSLTAHFEGQHELLRGLIAEAQASGDVDRDAPAVELAHALLAMLRGISMLVPMVKTIPEGLPSAQTIMRVLRSKQGKSKSSSRGRRRTPGRGKATGGPHDRGSRG